MTPDEILARAERALERRRPWEGVWRDCYDHVLAAHARRAAGRRCSTGPRRTRPRAWRPRCSPS